MKTTMPEVIKLDYYALGKYNKPLIPFKKGHNGFKDKAHDIVNRNSVYLNSSGIEFKDNIKHLATLNELDRETNNYLQPTKLYQMMDKYNPNEPIQNSATFKIIKEKIFSKYI
jgi:hypothetical protein